MLYRHHGGSITDISRRTGHDWLDRLWLFEGLLRTGGLDPAERDKLERLRRVALRRALRSQLARLARGRFGAELPAYLGFRARARAGRAQLHTAGQTLR